MVESTGWRWHAGTGKNNAGETMGCTALRHTDTGLTVEVRHDSAHGVLFRHKEGEVTRCDRFDASLLKRGFLAPHLVEVLDQGGGQDLIPGTPMMAGEWRQGLNATTKTLMLAFVYKDNTKIQFYLTSAGDCLWYSLSDNVLHLTGKDCGSAVVSRRAANGLLPK